MHSRAVSNWWRPSIWDDVRWDRAAADELVRQLLAAAGAIGDVLAVLAGPGPIDVADWGGPHRLAYDADRDQLVARAHHLAEALVATAARVGAQAEAAEGEQRLRVRLRHQALADDDCASGRAC